MSEWGLLKTHVETWIEPVDDYVAAVLVRSAKVSHGQAYVLSVFTLFDAPRTASERNKVSALARLRFDEVLERRYGGDLPYAGSIRVCGPV